MQDEGCVPYEGVYATVPCPSRPSAASQPGGWLGLDSQRPAAYEVIKGNTPPKAGDAGFARMGDGCAVPREMRLAMRRISLLLEAKEEVSHETKLEKTVNRRCTIADAQ